MKRMTAVALLVGLVSAHGRADAPPPLPSADDINKDVKSYFEAARRMNARLGDKDTAKLLADAEAKANKAALGFGKLDGEIKTQRAKVKELEELAKKPPERKDARDDADHAKRLREWATKIAELPKLKSGLEKADERLAEAQRLLLSAQKEAEDAANNDKAAKDIPKDFDALAKKLEKLEVEKTLQSLQIKGLDAQQQIGVLVARLDRAILGNYVQAKLEGLLASEEFCKAQASCGKPEQRQDLKGLFNGKPTHGK